MNGSKTFMIIIWQRSNFNTERQSLRNKKKFVTAGFEQLAYLGVTFNAYEIFMN